MKTSLSGVAALALLVLLPTLSRAQVPVFVLTPQESTIEFTVKASVPLEGKFDKWESSVKFTSRDVTTGVLDIRIQAASVDTGSGIKNSKLKSKDFFDVKNSPLITFHSHKVVQTGPATLELPGTFTIRGVSKTETLTLHITGKGTGEGFITGTMAFDRKQYGMNSGIPFIKIADRVEVSVNLKGKQTSGPPLVYQQ
jgi:polyisoprenoid-binding protein YceI